LLVELKIH